MLQPASRNVIMANDRPAAAGGVDQLATDLWRVTAQNASPLTGPGTNSYVLGESRLVIIDPGPDDPAHRQALLQVIDGRPVGGIILTHAHRDHSDGARDLALHLEAPLMALGDARTGRSARMQAFVADGTLTEGAATDYALMPDVVLADGDTVTIDRDGMQVIHTPGHLSHHICLKWRDIVFTGDHIMGWSSTVVVAPDGDMAQYIESLRRLERRLSDGPKVIGLAGHGDVIPDLLPRITALYHHRQDREKAILAAIAAGKKSLSDITLAAYPGLSAALLPFAEKSCHAHLLALEED